MKVEGERDLMWTTLRILNRYTPITPEQVRERKRELMNIQVKSLVEK